MPRKTWPVDCRERLRGFCRYNSPAPLARMRKPPMMAMVREYMRTWGATVSAEPPGDGKGVPKGCVGGGLTFSQSP